MRDKIFKVRRDALSVFVGLVGIEVYWPAVYWSATHKGAFLPTLLTWRPEHDWKWEWAAAFKVLGFGLGVSYNHCDNPAYVSQSP